jgi:hypothetical protein
MSLWDVSGCDSVRAQSRLDGVHPLFVADGVFVA